MNTKPVYGPECGGDASTLHTAHHMTPETIPEALALHVADTLPQDAGKRLREQIERAYMAGALEALQRVQAGREVHALRAEVIGWARASIGRESR